MANLENQEINRVLGIWYNGEFGKFGKSTDQQRFLVPIQKILRMANLENQQINRILDILYNGGFGKFGKSTDQQIFSVPIQ